MDITPLVGVDQQIIQSYSNGRFKVSGRIYDSALVVFTDRCEEWVGAENLTAESFAQVLARKDELDVVLFGCGAQFRLMEPALRKELRAAGIVVDIMDTGAACRTYNVLMAEGRRVAACLLPV
jgi:uncharacterized protein